MARPPEFDPRGVLWGNQAHWPLFLGTSGARRRSAGAIAKRTAKKVAKAEAKAKAKRENAKGKGKDDNESVFEEC
jgi:hypothetical protein